MLCEAHYYHDAFTGSPASTSCLFFAAAALLVEDVVVNSCLCAGAVWLVFQIGAEMHQATPEVKKMFLMRSAQGQSAG